MKYILFFLLVWIWGGTSLLSAQLQEDAIEAPDMAEIQEQINDPSSPLYYPVLMQRYLDNDTTLNLAEYRCLYISAFPVLRVPCPSFRGNVATVRYARLCPAAAATRHKRGMMGGARSRVFSTPSAFFAFFWHIEKGGALCPFLFCRMEHFWHIERGGHPPMFCCT